jgi:monofunctional biosynthetic peptidoglycan transglycosylase
MLMAALAAEDQNFPRHHGFDFAAIKRAYEHNKGGGTLHGASTITQQVAKNLFLWPAQSYLRKGLEAGYTVFIELLWSKKRILEMYLNIAQFGKSVYGVEAASRVYFGKTARQLTRDQASLLAAVLPNPERYSASKPSSLVRKRIYWIQRQMRQLGGEAFLGRL